MKEQSIDADFITNIVNTYSDMMLRIAFHYTDNTYDAEDIVQNVFLALLKKDISHFEEDALKAYIIRCTINKGKDFYRLKTKRQIVPIEEAYHVVSDEKESIMDEIRNLPLKYREVIYLHYYEGYTCEQIGKTLSLNRNTVSTRLRRARQKLKTVLQEEKYESI